MIITYGYKMTGLKAAAGATRFLSGYYFDCAEVEIFYNADAGRVSAVYHGGQFGDVYGRAPDGFKIICRTRYKMTMQEIADAIAEYMNGGE